jgi:hypothetical protein
MPRGVNRPPLLAHDYIADALSPITGELIMGPNVSSEARLCAFQAHMA